MFDDARERVLSDLVVVAVAVACFAHHIRHRMIESKIILSRKVAVMSLCAGENPPAYCKLRMMMFPLTCPQLLQEVFFPSEYQLWKPLILLIVCSRVKLRLLLFVPCDKLCDISIKRNSNKSLMLEKKSKASSLVVTLLCKK